VTNDTLQPIRDGAHVVLLTAEEGDARDRMIAGWLGDVQAPGRDGWHLDCDVERFGLFAGLENWLLSLHPRMEERAPDLVAEHDYELLKTVPRLRERYTFLRPTLTETAPADEAVRNYAMDRGFRIGQGLVDLLVAWYERSGASSWVVVADNFDRAGALVQRFFLELIRRRASRLNLTIVFVMHPNTVSTFTERLEAVWSPSTVRISLPAGRAERTSPQQFRERALELEALVGRKQLPTEIHLPELIYSWRRSDEPHRAIRWQAMAFGLYNHYGFYEDAHPFCDIVLEHLDDLTSEFSTLFSRWNLVGTIFGCLAAIGQPERACQIVEREGLDKVTDPVDVARICYVLAMLHSRFLPTHDLSRAEQYIEDGLNALARGEVHEHVRRFLSVFLRNGLAFIRHRQGRPLEAITMCETGFAELDEYLPRDSHRLHRSVLLYNIAQVYAALRSHEKAIESFTAALDMDPNYSEYYNERGSVYLQCGRFDDAIADYRRAIAASPPYAEVWTNLGQCYRQMKAYPEAADAYARALDLDPQFRLALVGDADVSVRMECWDRALARYDVLLSTNPNQPLILANRAFVLERLDRLEEALDTLNRALALAPNEAVLYQNRASLHGRLGRAEHADDTRELQPVAKR
jgi:tetratricopeptide (TPR) repeat protein